MHSTVISEKDLSETAKEITFAIPEPLGFIPGAFVNIFIEKDGVMVRRAYSISSDYAEQKSFTISVRKSLHGGVSQLFWQAGLRERNIEVMGPMGMNTADKIEKHRLFLFGFGIGVSVIKSVLHYATNQSHISEITVVTGNRTENDILYKEFFNECVQKDKRVTTRYIVSDPIDPTYPYTGYIQDHIEDFDFTDSTVYICGQDKACTALRAKIEEKGVTGIQFLTESFG